MNLEARRYDVDVRLMLLSNASQNKVKCKNLLYPKYIPTHIQEKQVPKYSKSGSKYQFRKSSYTRTYPEETDTHVPKLRAKYYFRKLSYTRTYLEETRTQIRIYYAEITEQAVSIICR